MKCHTSQNDYSSLIVSIKISVIITSLPIDYSIERFKSNWISKDFLILWMAWPIPECRTTTWDTKLIEALISVQAPWTSWPYQRLVHVLPQNRNWLRVKTPTSWVQHRKLKGQRTFLNIYNGMSLSNGSYGVKSLSIYLQDINPYVIMNWVKVVANAVAVIPIANKTDPNKAIFLYPNLRNNGPWISPTPIPNAEFTLRIIVTSVAGTLSFLNTSFNTRLKPCNIGIMITCGKKYQWKLWHGQFFTKFFIHHRSLCKYFFFQLETWQCTFSKYSSLYIWKYVRRKYIRIFETLVILWWFYCVEIKKIVIVQ